MRKEASAEMSLRIAAALCSFFLRQGLQVSCYGNGVDILTHEPVSIHAKNGSRQMDSIYRTLSRVDVKQPAASFCGTFEETVFEDSQGALTCFVAANQYNDFVDLLTRYQERENTFVWFYPVQNGEQLPGLPPAVARHVSVLYPDV